MGAQADIGRIFNRAEELKAKVGASQAIAEENTAEIKAKEEEFVRRIDLFEASRKTSKNKVKPEASSSASSSSQALDLSFFC